ncbi:MAG: indolepyruvate ferredoxin oxidoreductase subunit alpha [Ruminococcaceae bacterium]|nr:indolepyruvate ferredoxin oxidoreductase subunit alpha [Oscillospiraceae bacterium]
MKKLMLGNEAVARGAYEAGVTVVSSYPGTPSTEITEYISKYDEIYSEWASNEKVATEVAIGASIAGARSMTAMKHVGVNVAADPLYTASYTGVNGGLVLMVADDPGMHSSQNEQDSRNHAKACKVPMLEPADSSECKEYVKRAYEISERFDTPVMVRLTTRVAHSQSLVELDEREAYELKEMKKDPSKYVMMPAMAIKRHVFVEERMRDLATFAGESDLNRMEINDTKIGVIAAGITYQYVKEALPEASVLKLGMVHPINADLIREFASKVEKLYVVEELDPFIEEFCRAAGIDVIGKEVFTLLGEYTPALIRKAVLGEEIPAANVADEPVPNRPPVMCPGCPHRGTFYVLHKLGLTVCGDIGCYTLGAAAPLSSIDACVCMGASIGMAHGMEKARGKEFSKKAVAVLGDSTFIHSGITGLIDVVYNQGASTVIVLDNSITGMTGHQQNPTTGYTIKNEPTSSVNLIDLAHAVGIKRVVVADPFDLAEFERVVKEETASGEPSLIIAQRPCALLKNVNYGAPCEIDPQKCVTCKMCMKLGCPAIVYKDGKMHIDQSLCDGCELCTRVCKPGAIRKAGGSNE